MYKAATILFFLIALVHVGCKKETEPVPNRGVEPSSPVEVEAGSPVAETMQVRELVAPARVAGSIEGDLDQLPAMMARLRQFASDVDSKQAGPVVLLFTRLNDGVDSTVPKTEVYLPAEAWPGMPEGGDDISIVRTVPCQIASRMVQGSLLNPLPELASLKQWATEQGLKTGPVPGAILHTPEAPLDNQRFELFYPILPKSPLPPGTISLCSPALDSEQ